MVKYVDLAADMITPTMFLGFHHCQTITKKWVRHGSEWFIEHTSELRQWSNEKRIWISKYIHHQIERNGSCIAAYDGDELIGFCCIDGCLLGKTAAYANLSMLFVDDRWRSKGIGKTLFHKICKQAVCLKANKLFISAIPSFETVSIYLSFGCKDATELIPEYIDSENDRYLEYSLEAYPTK